MKRLRAIIMGAMGLTLAVAAPGAVSAQQTSVDPGSSLEEALSVRASEVEADRSTILRFLERDEVEDAAASGRIDLERVRAAVASMDAGDLERLAPQVQQMDDLMAGGDRIIITSTTIIIILLILILVAVS